MTVKDTKHLNSVTMMFCGIYWSGLHLSLFGWRKEGLQGRPVYGECSVLTCFYSSSFAPANQYVLLNWACTVYTALLQCYNVTESTEAWKTLVGVIGFLLNRLLNRDVRVKDAMRRGATTRVRRAVRGVRVELFVFGFKQINLMTPISLQT